MRYEFDSETIRFSSDRVGFEGFRALVRDLPDEFEVGSGRLGLSSFLFSCRPVQEKGQTILRYEASDQALIRSRITSIIIPNEPFLISSCGAAGRIVSFEIHPRFFEETLRRVGLTAIRYQAMPSPRFVINQRVDWLCQLLMQETERGCPSGRAYFEHIASALLMSVVLQGDPRLPDTGNTKAQLRRVQKAAAFLETNYRSKLSLEQVARTSGLSPFHFSRLLGVPPHQYLLRCRLRHVLEMLSAIGPSPSLAEVAIECGFADQAHLTRHFRRAYGFTPRQFRRGKKAQE